MPQLGQELEDAKARIAQLHAQPSTERSHYKIEGLLCEKVTLLEVSSNDLRAHNGNLQRTIDALIAQLGHARDQSLAKGPVAAVRSLASGESAASRQRLRRRQRRFRLLERRLLSPGYASARAYRGSVRDCDTYRAGPHHDRSSQQRRRWVAASTAGGLGSQRG